MTEQQLALLKATANHLIALGQRQQFEGADTLDAVIDGLAGLKTINEPLTPPPDIAPL